MDREQQQEWMASAQREILKARKNMPDQEACLTVTFCHEEVTAILTALEIAGEL